MSDGVQGRGGETAAQRRERISRQVRRWCEQARIEGGPSELSDDAAVLIAAGYLDEPTRQVLTNRRRAGRGVPTILGFTQLRLLTDEQTRLEQRAAQSRPGAASLVAGYRATELARRLQAARSAVVMSGAHYASGVRAIRRDRRDGMHLEPAQREALFVALQRTPASLPGERRPVEQVLGAAFGAAADRIAARSVGTALAAASKRAAEVLGAGSDLDGERFVDPVDALLFLAGTLFDRIEGSAAWHSEHFAVQRVQLDLAEELTQIAVDAVALRGIGAELAVALRSARVEAARDQIQARQRALEPVWDQLVERVAALARIGDLLGQAEDQLRSMAAVERTLSLDSRIDDLIARSGNRELSAQNTHHVGDQFGEVEALMLGYQDVLYGDILALTTRSRPGGGSA
ncbi:hypothetical protein [Rhodococcus tukisamuensis]|uniref:Uncharacterized protein n=1 Tax=Rhodococcus tukisamuensis TaxID=168276 RepID=A0A1G7CGI4_9NOCA|nr:hypothetical protein [Rhodococcus tukisamuensis]SDE38381.1 hypothetical protein SAMN05444580_1166 [Rhodococcus tukisamuensis]